MIYELKDICTPLKGTQIDTSLLSDKNPYKYINGGTKESGYHIEANTLGNTVIVSEGGASCGYVNFIDTDFWCGCHCYKLTEPKVNAKYLYYALKANQDKIMELRTGAAMPNIKKSTFIRFKLDIINDEKLQKTIVSELDKIQDALANKNEQLKKLDELIQSKFYEMFGDPMENNMCWGTKTYGEIFDLFAGGTPSKSKSEYWENGNISWIGSNLCQDSILYKNDGKYITELGLARSSAKLFPKGTVLIALVGATIGKTAMLRFETTTNQNVLGVLKIEEAGYHPIFVFYYTQGLRKYFLNIGDGGFAMASKTFVSNLPIFDIDKTLQQAFANYVEKVEEAKVIVNQEIAHLQELLDSRMDFYFRK